MRMRIKPRISRIKRIIDTQKLEIIKKTTDYTDYTDYIIIRIDKSVKSDKSVVEKNKNLYNLWLNKKK